MLGGQQGQIEVDLGIRRLVLLGFGLTLGSMLFRRHSRPKNNEVSCCLWMIR